MSITQILVVDDSVPWLPMSKRILEQENGLKSIAATSDGLEAVQKAKDLRPDVVLMDVNLPGANGFEIARRIRMVPPASKILFLSDQRNPELIREAFRVGALGYISKLDSHSDLIIGIRTVLRGQQFVSNSLANWRNGADGANRDGS